jgi:hypothetical protein
MKLLLAEVGDRPETVTIDGVEYLVHSKHKCILDALTEASPLQHLGWADVQVIPVD